MTPPKTRAEVVRALQGLRDAEDYNEKDADNVGDHTAAQRHDDNVAALDFAIAALSAMEGEAVAWQFRECHPWDTHNPDAWSPWKECSPALRDTIRNHAQFDGAVHEIRPLYTAPPPQQADLITRALAYLGPHLELGTFAAPDWAIQLASILTGGDGCGTPIPHIPTPSPGPQGGGEGVWKLQRWAMAKGSDGQRWSVYMDHDENGEWVKWAHVRQAILLTEILASTATPPQPEAQVSDAMVRELAALERECQEAWMLPPNTVVIEWAKVAALTTSGRDGDG